MDPDNAQYLSLNLASAVDKVYQRNILRAIAGNTSRIKFFLILCTQFVLCMDCRFMKLKGYVTTLDFS